MNRALIASTAAVAALALLGGTYYATMRTGDALAECRTSSVAGGAIGGPFELVNADGQTVTDKDVITAPTLVYFGYTFCPDVCPFDAARNGEAVTMLEERGHTINSVFISVDPERDTPETVSDYASYMHPRMVGLTGSPEQVKVASKAYKTYYKKQLPEDGDNEYYLVDHSTFTYLMFPETGFAEFYRREATSEQIADSVECFIENM
ncbi:SCO family protein [Thalassovita mediterranea]|jgi:protein SCO1/2|uniref:SCO1/SenC n=1 Tax=Thalassovita mediterranea TaxID=340021 RepID=A0A0P1GSB9_9RHOB|nr:SCO family protein [Thalassovita mediterranea]MCG7572720.1 SCO family protein [Phaeobacter sp. CNT1-3]CUH85447.1 SCO1/SenC [Thalassovita mediterranea]SIS31696.1 protein SCO1/2 [Thalassovita mediterranea]